MAKLQTAFFGLLFIAITFQQSCGTSGANQQDNDIEGSYEVIETRLQSRSLADDSESEQNSNLYALRRQRRSPHIGFGTHHIRPVYVQPQQIAPVHGYYPRPVHYPPIQPQANSHSHAQAISASFGNNHLLGAGGSGISAAAASSGSNAGNQLIHHGYRRK